MSYNKTTWTNGDIITAEKLNNIEDGIASGGSGGVLVVSTVYDDDSGKTYLNKTFEEVKNFMLSGGMIWLSNYGELVFVEGLEGDPDIFYCRSFFMDISDSKLTYDYLTISKNLDGRGEVNIFVNKYILTEDSDN